MFGLLKNKISSFINNLTQKKTEEETEEKLPPAAPEKIKEMPPQPTQQPSLIETPREKLEEKKPVKEETSMEKETPTKEETLMKERTSRKKETPEKEEPYPKETTPAKEERQSTPPRIEPIPPAEPTSSSKKKFEPIPPKPAPQQKPKEETCPTPEKKEEEKPAVVPAAKTQVGRPAGFLEQIRGIVQKPVELLKQEKPKQEERKLEAKLSLESRVRSIFSTEVEIRDKDVRGLLENLEIALLESDVAFEVSQALVEDLRARLVGKRVAKEKVGEEVRSAVKHSLVSVMSIEKPDFWRIINEKQKPVKILFVGPNGAGKTTTMSKLASIILSKNYSCLFSASDTFRAAAIEQTIHHAEKLGIGVVKHNYGSDPAAVAFDAVSSATSGGIDVVLIDSAGRQDTNVNLIDELKKINRVIKPDLKIFVGESIAGNAIIDQVKAFHEAIGLDAIILTKLDCDAKGGTAISISKTTGVPILFIGVGQEYKDLIEFDAQSIAEQILT